MPGGAIGCWGYSGLGYWLCGSRGSASVVAIKCLLLSWCGRESSRVTGCDYPERLPKETGSDRDCVRKNGDRNITGGVCERQRTKTNCHCAARRGYDRSGKQG